MNKLPMVVIWCVAAAVILLFTWALGLAAYYSVWVDPPTPDEVRPFATYVASAVNGILAANLGAILGITAVRGFRATISAPEKLQWIAAAVYVGIVLIVMGVWANVKFEENPALMAAPIPEVARTGIGVLIAVFAAALGVQGVRAGQRMES